MKHKAITCQWTSTVEKFTVFNAPTNSKVCNECYYLVQSNDFNAITNICKECEGVINYENSK
jgi:hypothetical protein